MDFKNNKYKYKAHPKWKNIEKKLNGINIKIKKDFIFIKANQSLTRIKYYKISCIKGLKDYVKVYANVYSIKYFEQKIPLNDFIRINKSYIISIDRIEKIEFNHVFSRSVKY